MQELPLLVPVNGGKKPSSRISLSLFLSLFFFFLSFFLSFFFVVVVVVISEIEC